MLEKLNDPISWAALFADSAPTDDRLGSEAEERLSEQVWARPRQRLSARAAIEFNARLPLRTRQDGIMPVRVQASDALPNARDT